MRKLAWVACSAWVLFGASALFGGCAASSDSESGGGSDGGADTATDHDTPLEASVSDGDLLGDAADDAVDESDANVDTRPHGEIVVSNEENPRGVAVDDTYVYWATNGSASSGKAIRRAPLAGAAPTTLVADLVGPIVQTSDASYVYFLEFATDDGSVKRVAKTGGAAETLAATAKASVAILSPDATSVLFGTSDGKIRKVAKGGGAVSDLVTGKGYIYGLAADAQYIYFTTGVTSGGPSPIPTTTVYTLERAPIGGGASTVLHTPAYSGGQLYGVGLALGNVVFANSYENRVYALPGDGGAPQLLTSGTKPSQLVSDGTLAFWINDLGGAHASIGRFALSGAVVSPTVAFEQPGAYGITYDATHVYWANRVEGTIRRAMK